ncbi:MAG: class I SAM-dependent methyltransferase [Bacteroidota bacterium]
MRELIKFIVRKIPRPVLIKFSFVFGKIVSFFYIGNKVECTVCGKHFRKFLPYGNLGQDNRLCPSCLSLERHRLIWLYLKDKTNFFTDKLDVLHIAPEQPFYKRFEKLENLNYTTADLESPIAEVKMDIREMPFEDNSFDVLLCNHVLEHIDDELKATNEIKRVLKPGGWAILQVPLDTSLETTYEDLNITDPKEREKHFGQYDHVRLYGRDYAQRLEKSGLKVTADDFVKKFSDDEVGRYRFDKNEMIYFCKKEN